MEIATHGAAKDDPDGVQTCIRLFERDGYRFE